MKLISSLMLGSALALGATPLVAAKNKPAAAPAAYSYKLSAPFRTIFGQAQAALKANDNASAEVKIAAVEAAAAQPDEKYVAAQLRLDLASRLKDTAMQSRAVDAMLASGSGAAAGDLARLHFYAGNFAYTANNLPRAIQMLTEAERLGYKDNNIVLLLAETNFKAKNIPAGLAHVERAIAGVPAGQSAPESWYARAASVANNAKLLGETNKWTRAHVRAYPTKENWRSALINFRDSATREGQLNLDIFRLMRATKSLAGERDYYELAALASERGLPGEAKSVIDEGMAVSAFPVSSRALNELRTLVTAKISGDTASLAAAERQVASGATGRAASATADAYLGYGQDAKAAALYKMAIAKGGVDMDAVNTRLGIALTRLGQKDDARAALAAVKGPRAEIAAFWLLWLDQQV